jgi:hypothetical protein
MGNETVLEAIGKGSIKATMQVGGELTHNHHPNSSCSKNEK